MHKHVGDKLPRIKVGTGKRIKRRVNLKKTTNTGCKRGNKHHNSNNNEMLNGRRKNAELCIGRVALGLVIQGFMIYYL